MKLKIICPARIKEEFILLGEQEYLKRYKPLSNLVFEEASLSSIGANSSPEERKKAEGEAILARVKKSDFVIALDEKGRKFTSKEFALFMQERMNQGQSQIAFIIGGAFGLSDAVRERADVMLSLSKFTFPHHISRLLLIEQLCRAFSILSGGPYHKS